MLRHLKILSRQQNSGRFLFAKILQATGICRLFLIQRKGYKLRFLPSNLSLQFWIEPNARDEDLEFFRLFLKPGDIAIDVGANIGDTALAMASIVGRQGKILAIEAHPQTFRFLCENVRLNNAIQIKCLSVALGNHIGEVKLSTSKRDDMNHVGDGTLSVPLETLDGVAAELERTALLKIDVEGYEKFVLAGADKTLGNVGCVYFEVAELNCIRFGYHVADILMLLESAGFLLFRRVAKGFCQIDNQYKPEEVENLIAVRDTRNLTQRTNLRIIC
jgi:FkbM family methyltransferase